MHFCVAFTLFCILFVLLETPVEKEIHPDSSLVQNNTESKDDSSVKTLTKADSETQSSCDKSEEKTTNISENKSDSGVSVDIQSDIIKESETDSGDSVERSEPVQITTESAVIHRTGEPSDEKSVSPVPTISLPKTDDSNVKSRLGPSITVGGPISPVTPESPQFEYSYEEDLIPGGKFMEDGTVILFYVSEL